MRNLIFIGAVFLFFTISCAGHRADEKAVTDMSVNMSSKKDGLIDEKQNKTSANDKTANGFAYILGPGDEISINVWRNSDLNRTVKIDPHGFIYLPLAGEVQSSGMTISELRKDITSRLSKFLVNPQVDINISAVKSQKLHILGEVKHPGTYTFDSQITVLEAILKAGGLTDDANTKNILIARIEGDVVKLNTMSLNIKERFKEGRIEEIFYLRNGDTIYAPEKRIASFERFMQRMKNIIDPLYTVERGIVLAPDVEDVLRGNDDNGGSIIIGN